MKTAVRSLVFAMQTHSAPVIRYDVQSMAEDMASKGWTKLDLATKAGVSDMTVIRFLRGEHQTAPVAKKLAKSLGRTVRHYLRTKGRAA